MLLDYLGSVSDSRRGQGRMYGLSFVLFFTILAVLSGARSYRQIHSFMVVHLEYFRREFGLNWHRAPSYTGLRAILQGVSATSLEAAFRDYSAALAAGMPEKCQILACDGKVLRGSFDAMEDRKAAQILSIFAVDGQLVLAHAAIPDKTNEIPSFQALVKELNLSGKLFTLDAMHTQKNPSGSEEKRQRSGASGEGKSGAIAG